MNAYLGINHLQTIEPKLFTLGIFDVLLRTIESDTYCLITCGKNANLEYKDNSLYFTCNKQKRLIVNNDRQQCLDFVKEHISTF